MPELNRQQFFHVSDHAFAPGEELLPRSRTGVRRSEGEGSVDADHVYMTDDVHSAVGNWAHVFAQNQGTPQHVYEVEPRGRVEVGHPYDDPEHGIEHKAPAAVVRRRIGTYEDGGMQSTWHVDAPEHAGVMEHSPWVRTVRRA